MTPGARPLVSVVLSFRNEAANIPVLISRLAAMFATQEVDYEVVYVFGVGRFDIDRTRVYMPFQEAQSYFNREGAADEIEVRLFGTWSGPVPIDTNDAVNASPRSVRIIHCERGPSHCSSVTRVWKSAFS